MANNGRPEAALDYYIRALELNPGYIRARSVNRTTLSGRWQAHFVSPFPPTQVQFGHLVYQSPREFSKPAVYVSAI